MFAGKKRMGQRGRRERISLYFSTSCFFSCVRIDCQRWYEMHVGSLFDLVWVRVAYLVWKFGLRGLWVAAGIFFFLYIIQTSRRYDKCS